MSQIEIIPLGGLGEIGKNMTAIGFDNEYILVDAGMSFPDETVMNGVSKVMPDMTFVRENREKIKGLFITHGHEDHIGSVPAFMSEFKDIPVHATELTIEFIKNKLRYHSEKGLAKKLKEIKPGGGSLQFEKLEMSFFSTVHSIYNSVAIVVNTPIGNVVHMGDFKLDYSPIDGVKMDVDRLIELRNEGVKVLISDSTNASKPGMSVPESTVADNLKREMKLATGKTIVSTFASSLPRVQSILDIAEDLKKKVLVLGTGMKRNVNASIRLGYIKVDPGLLVSVNESKKLKDEELVIIATGAQGESMAGLSRLAFDRNEDIKLNENDTVIFSSGIVPGNESQVNYLKEQLAKKSANVVQTPEIHTSGHGHQEDLKYILDMLKPEYFVPSHGEFKMLRDHKKLAELVGVIPDNIFICKNGSVVSVTEEGAQSKKPLPYEPTLLDHSGNGVVTRDVNNDRGRMSRQGVVVVTVEYSKSRKTFTFSLRLRGVASKVDGDKIKRMLESELRNEFEKTDSIPRLNRVVTGSLSGLLNKENKIKPLVIPVIDFKK